jgi:phosphohistidine swiveling domain-containing protein
MFTFCTKANTLKKMQPLLTRSVVPDSFVLRASEWNSCKHALHARMQEQLACETVIVRSSAINEDGHEFSMAGAYTSILDVPLHDAAAVDAAINRVIASYLALNKPHKEDQVLVQPMISRISMSGVVLTQDLTSGAPYYVINYDDSSGRADSVTAGTGDTSRTLIVRRECTASVQSSRFRKLIEAVQEIEALTCSTALDIEFIVDADETIYTVQIRPMAVSQNWNRGISKKINATLEQIKSFIACRLHPVHGAAGSRSVWGIMPDWNPVEMLGAAPRRLAWSLYKYLITDSVWAQARAMMGYKDMGRRPLMHSFGGRMYIDVRESFNSFLPAGLPAPLQEKLVDMWLDRLEKHPELHDKVEFDVAVTAYTPDFRERVAPALLSGLTPQELDAYAAALKDMTCRILCGPQDILEESLGRIEKLDDGLGDAACAAGSPQPRLFFVQALLDRCRSNGTRPFSVVARCAFIAEAQLRGLVHCGCLSAGRAAAFRGSVRTVLSAFLDDLGRCASNQLSRDDFMRQYGHLRPSSYDILSLRYDQRITQLTPAAAPAAACTPADFVLTPQEVRSVDAVLEAHGYGCDAARLFSFMRRAIAGREYAKFRFSKHLSDSIESIAAWGESMGLTRDELAHLDIHDLLRCLSEVPCAESTEEYLRGRAQANAQEFEVTQALRMPFLVTSPSDIDVVPLLKSRPNFITTRYVQAKVILLTGQEISARNLHGRIVLIEGADPGFDWIFAHNIAGLITKYGGANSHMAIRCAEMDLPAAIGCGEQLFDAFSQAAELKLDCASEHITVL